MSKKRVHELGKKLKEQGIEAPTRSWSRSSTSSVTT